MHSAAVHVADRRQVTPGVLDGSGGRAWRATFLGLTGRLADSWWLSTLLLWAVSGLVVLCAAFAGTILIAGQRGWAEGAHCCGLSVPDGVRPPDKVLARWDAGYYGLIATQGYRPDGPERAFFPLFPLLARLGALALGGDVYRAGAVIAAVAALITGLCLYQLVRGFLGHRRAVLTVACLFTFPTAFYLFAPYAESLLLAAATCALWLARRGGVVRSGVLIAIAGLARPTGWILLLPLAIEGLSRYWRDPFGLARLGLGLSIGALGTVGALAIMHLGDDSRLWWSSYAQVNEQFWAVQFVGPWTTFAGAFMAALFGQGLGTDWFTRATAIAELTSGLLVAGAVLVLIARRAPASLTALTLATLLVIAAQYGPGGHALDSMPRHVLSIFPMFAAVAMALPGRTAALAWLGGCELLLAVATAWFASGRWVS